MDVRMPDGTIVTNVPEDITKDQLLAKYQGASTPAPQAAPRSNPLTVANYRQQGGLTADQALGSPQFQRQIGLTARAGLQGLAAIPGAIGDAIGLNSSGAVSNLLDKFLPSPANATERIANQAASGMVQPGAVGAAFPSLAARIGTQIASAGAGAASSQGAKEMGYGPMAQMGAGLAGGIAVPTAMAATAAGARALGRLPAAMVSPFTASGKQDAAARLMQGAATNRLDALDNINSAPNYVPGVNPTTAEVANDPGLSGLYKTLRNQNTPVFSNVEGANDAARQAYLAQQFGNPADIAAAKAARDAATGPMREAAFANAGAVDTAPIVATGNQSLEAGAKYRGALGTTLQKFVNDISEIKDPQVLYNGPRKAINDAIYGKVSQDSPLAQFTKQELIALRGKIDSQIEAVAPGFTNYLQTHANLSRGIDAQQLGQDITQAATNPMTERLSPAKFANQVQKNGPEIAQAGSTASDALMRVNEDLKRSVAPMNAMRVAGSDTVQNAIGNEILQKGIGSLPGGPTTKLASKVASWLYSLPNQQVQKLILDGIIDPKLGAGLLARKIPEKPDLVAGLLAQRFPIAYGGLLGTMSAQQPLGQ